MGRFQVVQMPLLAAIVIGATPAWAARIVGNGGVGVRCDAAVNPARAVEVLDYYEAERTWHIPPSLGAPDLDYLAKAKLVIDRIAAVDPDRGALYGGWLATFVADSWIYTDGQHFDLIKDYGDPILQDGCTVVQIAVQQRPEVPEDRRYLIDGSLWNLLDADSQAGLVLHELIFRDALARGHNDSVAAHYFTALYSSAEFLTMDTPTLDQRLRLYNMDAYIAPVAAGFHGVDATYVLFDGGEKTYAEASAKCASLGPDAGIFVADDLSFTPYFVLFADSAIGVRILAAAPNAAIWASNGYHYQLTASQGVQNGSVQVGAALVVCWVKP